MRQLSAGLDQNNRNTLLDKQRSRNKTTGPAPTMRTFWLISLDIAFLDSGHKPVIIELSGQRWRGLS